MNSDTVLGDGNYATDSTVIIGVHRRSEIRAHLRVLSRGLSPCRRERSSMYLSREECVFRFFKRLWGSVGSITRRGTRVVRERVFDCPQGYKVRVKIGACETLHGYRNSAYGVRGSLNVHLHRAREPPADPFTTMTRPTAREMRCAGLFLQHEWSSGGGVKTASS